MLKAGLKPGPIVSLALLLAACHSHPARPLPERAAPRITSGLPLASPEALGFDSASLAAAVAYVRAEEDSGAYPGAVLAVGRHGRLALLAPVGQYGVGEPQPVERTTVYDLASLTKVVGLNDGLACCWSTRRSCRSTSPPPPPPPQRPTLPDWRPLYREAATRGEALALVDTTPLAWSCAV